MKALAFTVFAIFVAFAFAEDDLGAAALTSDYVMLTGDNARFATINHILGNHYLNTFYDKYYSRPVRYQTRMIDNLISRTDESGLLDKTNYPYKNQIYVDPNIVNRAIRSYPRERLVNNINLKSKEYDTVSNNFNTKLAKTKQIYQNLKSNPINTKIANQLSNIDTQLKDYDMLSVPEHTYSTPFGEKGKNMNVLLDQIRTMEHKVKEPITPSLPNSEEIRAINRLSEKLSEISKRIHQKPLEDLHQNAHAQDLMLERLSNLIRRMSNSVEDSHRDQFLNQLHSMIHKYHLHDEKFISNLENEIGFALANNVPLAMPRTVQSLDNLNSAQAQPKVQTQVQAPTQAQTQTQTQTQAATVQAPAQAQTQAQTQLSENDKAKIISQNMEEYGKTLINQSKELKNRADILERRTTIPNSDREELLDHIRNRLISPPAEVHAVGAQRPAYYY